ncbi:hypothetical protein BDZ97DRAFT_1150891 [Flammula alnicola]|nr:hypothetical protein BDZ97DRAFT_1150891 [Flammula alnicola]
MIFTYAASQHLSVSKFGRLESAKGAKGHVVETTGYLNMEVVISHVCRQWRAVSLGLPTLWTTFYYSAHASSHIPLGRLEAYLQRSGMQLLDLWFDARGTQIRRARRKNILNLIQSTIPHVARWRRFIVLPDEYFTLVSILKGIEDLAAPNLENFSVSTSDMYPQVFASDNRFTEDRVISPLILREGAPKLSSLWMDTFGLVFYLPSMANLTTLHIEEDSCQTNMRSEKLISILTIPTLINLTMKGKISNYCTECGAARAQLPIITPNLRNLRICDMSICCFLLQWQAPLLDTLTFRKVQYRQSHHHIGGKQSNSLSFPNLRKLILIDSEPLHRQAGVLLTQLTDNIKELVISDSRRRSAMQTMMDLIRYDHYEHRQSWPQLRVITVNLRYVGMWRPSYYTECLRTRPKTLSLSVRIDTFLFEHWNTDYTDSLADLRNVCTIETLDDHIPNIPSGWPAADGPFADLLHGMDLSFMKRYSSEILLQM